MTNCEVEDNIADDNLNAKSNRFLLMLRGDCKFVTKVRNAQSELAKVAIIMDNTKASEGFNGIVMSADGNSRDIKIPSVFISESDGNKILASVLENSNSNFSVKISINFPTSKTDVPEMFLFSDPNNRGSYIFVREFYKYIKDNIHGGNNLLTQSPSASTTTSTTVLTLFATRETATLEPQSAPSLPSEIVLAEASTS